MNRFVAALLSVFVLALSLQFAAAQTDPTGPSVESKDSTSTAKTDVPDGVNAMGSFQHRLSFDLPGYRDLVPNIGLAYSSSFKGLGSAEVNLGVGWRLTGFSSIERVSVGGGSPSYDDARDVFRLNGSELLACADADANNSFASSTGGRTYPDRYKTDVASASCRAGGNMATMVESFRRIELKTEQHDGQSVDYFVVTATDGTQYTYRAIGVLNDDTANVVPADDDIRFKRKFLLTEIRDVQATPNVVSIDYDFETIEHGFAHRPKSVTYNGYVVEFGYENFADPLATFAIGSLTRLGAVHERLSSVEVKNDGTKIRAYSLNYDLSPVVKRHRLNEVRAYGNDYTASGSEITGGTQLPPLLRMVSYQGDGVDFVEETFAGTTFYTALEVVDLDKDNRDDLLARNDLVAECSTQPPIGQDEFEEECVPLADPTVRQHSIEIVNGVRTLQSQDAEVIWQRSLQLSATYGQRRYGLLPFMGKHSGHHMLMTEYDITPAYTQCTGDGCEDFDETWGPTGIGARKINPTSDVLSSLSPALLAGPVVGNFDDDPEYEVKVETGPGAAFYEFDGTGLVHSMDKPFSALGAANVHRNITIDVDGDGTDEQLFLEGIGYAGKPQQNGQWVLADHWGSDVFQSVLGPLGVADTVIGQGDFNGDGKTDIVTANNTAWSNTRSLFVQYSTGNGFLPPVELLSAFSSPALSAAYGANFTFATKSIVVRDVNGDGLGDVMLFGKAANTVSNTSPNQPVIYPRSEQGGAPEDQYDRSDAVAPSVWVFLSTGYGLVAESSYPVPVIANAGAQGDFDGNGLLDFAHPNASSGSISFNDAPYPNLLTGFTDALGGETVVAYVPSTAGANNNNAVPAVSQLVASIARKNGLGQTRTTEYSYVNSKYDYVNRRSLGFQTITAHLPQKSYEANPPQLVTVYHNDHIGNAGKVRSQTYTYDGTDDGTANGSMFKQTIATWTGNLDDTTNGPFRFDRAFERTKTAYGSSIIETKRQFSFDEFGQIYRIQDYGFAPGGVDADPDDDVRTGYYYITNPANYIMSTLKRKRVQAGALLGPDRAQWQIYEEYNYDGQTALSTAPIHGNRTRTRIWDGDLTSQNVVKEVVSEAEYDPHGNMIAQRDALGNETLFAYDAVKHQFPVQITNALGHVTASAWDEDCQAPISETDANGQTTTHVYDLHCRPVSSTLPNGHEVTTAYLNLGDPDAQYVETTQPSASLDTGSAVTFAREYMNGFGETYQTATSGSTSHIDDAIATRTYFDQRGKPSWTSVALTWAEAQDPSALPSTKQVRFSYDPIGRTLQTIQPNGAKSTTDYTVQAIAGSQPGTVNHPAVHSMDPHCFDGVSENICGEALSVMDYRGNMIRQTKFDAALTDAGAVNPNRVTEYRYDLLDRLIGVTDPGGAEWTYTHDFKGNRTSSDDPSLGLWALEYDANDNLTRQVDAKGQEILFTHDSLNRVLTKTVNSTDAAGLPQSDLITYGYDQNNTNLPSGFNIGQLTTLDGDHNTIEYRYDEVGNLTDERHILKGAHTGTYSFTRTFDTNGALIRQSLPTSSFGGTASMPDFEYDAAGRMTAFGSYVTAVDYNIHSNPLVTVLGNGMHENRSYDSTDSFLLTIRVKNGTTAGTKELSRYWRTKAGRVTKHRSWRAEDQYEYCYDYAGRLTVAADLEAESKTCETLGSWEGTALRDQFFTYRPDGSMSSNSHVGDYTYVGSPVAHAPASVEGQNFSYDANGNMTAGLNAKTMHYDGENRPLSVWQNGALVSEYVYGADGTRLKKIDSTGTTLYVGGVEIRNPGVSETVLTYPHPHIRLKFEGGNAPDVSYMFRDQLNSVTMIADENQAIEERSTYKPFGEENEQVLSASQAVETIGWIGERFDAGAGLQYLNARYYDPELALFLQPDWFEAADLRVGTNRYAYSFNDPVNLSDPGGNCPICGIARKAVADAGLSVAIDATIAHISGDDYTSNDAAVSAATGLVPGSVQRKGFKLGKIVAGKVAKKLEPVTQKAKSMASNALNSAGNNLKTTYNKIKNVRLLGSRKPKATNRGVCSFHADTLVLTDGGLLPISDVNTTMSVWSRNPANGDMDWQAVQAQYSNPYDETVSVTMRDAETGIEQTIVSNRIHPYFVQTTRAVANSSEGHIYAGPLENGHWVDAAKLQAGDRLLNDDGTWAVVVGVKVEAEPLTAFNLTVAEFHTYFVAANENAAPVWVHNDCFTSGVTERMNVRVNIDNGSATVSFKKRQATSLAASDIRALKAELREQGVQNVTINSGQIVEPTGRLQRILQQKADTGGTWGGSNVWATGNPNNPFVLTGGL